MPIFEYRCQNCRRRVTVLVRAAGRDDAPVCDRCGSADLSRLISRFAVHRSRGGGSEDSYDSDDLDGLDGEDPRAMADWMRRMQKEMGEESTPEFEEMVEDLESGKALEDDYDNSDDLP